MTKINMSGSNVGAKGICAVIDTNGTALPCLGTDNGDGTATLKIDGELTASIDPGTLATAANQTTGNNSLSSIDGKLTEIVQFHSNIDFSSASEQSIVAAPGAGYRIRLCQLLLMSGADPAVNSEIAVKSGSTTIKTVKGASVALDFPEHCNLGTNEALVLQATTADRVIGGVDYYVEAV